MKLFFKIDHILEPYSVFINRILIIVNKKILYAVTFSETAVFIKGNRKFTVPCTYPYYIKIIFIFSSFQAYSFL